MDSPLIIDMLYEQACAARLLVFRRVAALPGADGPHNGGCVCQDCLALASINRVCGELADATHRIARAGRELLPGEGALVERRTA